MGSLRHAAYRASILAPNALQLSRVALRSIQYAPKLRSSIALFSTRTTLLSDAFDRFPSRSEPGGRPYTDIGSPKKVLYIGNLFFDVTPNQLRQHFEPYGAITNSRVVTSPEGHSKGYAFVEFETVEAAQDAQVGANLSVFAGRRIIVHFARPGAGNEPRRRTNDPSSTVFVGNLNFDMSDRELNELFRPLKGIKDVRVSVDRKTGRPRGFAHADFIDVESAVAAFEELNGKLVRERSLRCDYSDNNSTQTRAHRGMAENIHREVSEASAGGARNRKPQWGDSEATPEQNAPAEANEESTPSEDLEAKDEDVKEVESGEEGSHEPPQDLDNQPEGQKEEDFEQPEEHATQKLEKEIEKVPEDQAEKKD